MRARRNTPRHWMIGTCAGLFLVCPLPKPVSAGAPIGLSLRAMEGFPVAVGVPIGLGSHLLLEPLFVIDKATYDYRVGGFRPTEGSETSIGGGIGAYWMTNSSPARLLLGPRVGWSHRNNTSETEAPVFNGDSVGVETLKTEDSASGPTLSLTAALESAVSSRFVVGGEAAWSFEWLEGEYESPYLGDQDSEIDRTNLAGALYVRWYLWGREPF